MTMVKGYVTCDNTYAVWLGDANQVYQELQRADNTKNKDIRSAEKVKFCCDVGCYLYIAAWDDDKVAQGLLASFTGQQTVGTGDPGWEVYPTGLSLASGTFPTQAQLDAQIVIANGAGWKTPYAGGDNASTPQPWNFNVANIAPTAKWVWYDSGADGRAKHPASPYVPFAKFDHGDMLLFRIPCHKFIGCAAKKLDADAILMAGADDKEFTLYPKGQGTPKCKAIKLPKLEPAFALKWGDGPSDQMETHDDECMYLIAQNPYGNITFKDVMVVITQITDAAGNPVPSLPNGTPAAVIKPGAAICFGDIGPCDAQNPKAGQVARELVLLTQHVLAGTYLFHLEYCFKVEVAREGKSTFELKLVDS